MTHDFHGHELLLLKRLQTDSTLRFQWRTKLQNKLLDDDYDLGVRILSQILCHSYTGSGFIKLFGRCGTCRNGLMSKGSVFLIRKLSGIYEIYIPLTLSY